MSKANRRRNARQRRSAAKAGPETDPSDEKGGYDEGGADVSPTPAPEGAAKAPPPGGGGGLIDGGGQPQGQTQQMEDPVLQQAEMELERRLLPDVRRDYMKIVVAGMKIGMVKNGQLVSSLMHSKDPLKDCAQGAVAVGVILLHESKNTAPIKALIPAMMTLMLKALDFCDKAGIVKVGPAELAHASKIFANYLMHIFKITPRRFESMASQVHTVMQDPGQRELLERKVGLTKDPRAGVGTTLTKGA